MHYKLLLVGCLLASIGFSAQSVQAATTIEGTITTTTWTTADSPYYIPTTASVSTGNTLTIEPGVVVKFGDAARLVVSGNLVADGTNTDPIIFTSYLDDDYGGDTNGDGTATTPWLGDWNDILFPMQRIAPSASFDYVLVQYGGQTENSAMLTARSGDISVTNSTFQHSANRLLHAEAVADMLLDHNSFDVNGSSESYAVVSGGEITNNHFTGSDYICLHGSDAILISGNTFSGCYTGIQLSSADTVITENIITNNLFGITWEGTTGEPTVTHNAIYNNRNYGIYNIATSYRFPAENNWWGDSSGPYHATSNPAGLGDAVDDSVDFDPWLTSDPTSDVVAPGDVTIGEITKDPWNKTMTLNWTNPTDADFDHVQIDRLAADGSTTTLTTTEEGTNYLDATVEYDTYYTYTFYAIDTAGNSSTGVSSAEYQVRSPEVKHLRLAARDGVILVRWSRIPLHSTLGYKVYYGTSPDLLTSTIDVGPSSRRVLTGLRSGRTYYVAVAAYNRDGVIGPLSVVRSIEL